MSQLHGAYSMNPNCLWLSLSFHFFLFLLASRGICSQDDHCSATADVQWFTGLPLGGATIDLLSSAQNLDCAHLYNVISWTEMGLYSLIVGVLNYFLFCCFCPLWFLSFSSFVLWCFCPFGLLSVRLHDHMNRMLIVLTCISWSHEQKWDCTPWLLEY